MVRLILGHKETNLGYVRYLEDGRAGALILQTQGKGKLKFAFQLEGNIDFPPLTPS